MAYDVRKRLAELNTEIRGGSGMTRPVMTQDDIALTLAREVKAAAIAACKDQCMEENELAEDCTACARAIEAEIKL